MCFFFGPDASQGFWAGVFTKPWCLTCWVLLPLIIGHTISFNDFDILASELDVVRICPKKAALDLPEGLVFWTLRQNLPFCVRGVS